jgi:hypothetical protein
MKRAALASIVGFAALTALAPIRPTTPTNLHVLQFVGNNYYAATTGSSSNSGLSINSPWPLSLAISQAGPSNVITLLPGTYPSIDIARPELSSLTLRSQIKWAAKIQGSPVMHGISIGVGVSNIVIDGLQVDHAFIDGIKINGSGNTVRNCWIHHSGLGNPSAAPNGDASFSGQGVYIGCYNNNTIEYSLIESNGVWNGNDHGIYISGTNCVVRGNVLRYNWAYGLQLYTGYAGQSCCGLKVYDNLIYRNGICNGGRNCLTVWAGPPAGNVGTTNYVFNNTLISDTWNPVVADGGYLALSNNIILGSYDGSVAGVDGAVIWCDYNLLTNTLHAGNGVVNGGHNIITNGASFVNAGNGLFSLRSYSPARGVANGSVIPPVDFFGKNQSSVADVGAFQYSPLYESDTRVLDPSPTNPDYWLGQ